MHQERVADKVYFFQSEIYAEVTAGVVAGPDMAVVIDTLAMPEESIQIRRFVENELKLPIRYVINTHYHADHTWGNCFFPNAIIVSSKKCYDLQIENGIPSLAKEKKRNSQLKDVNIRLPQLTFDTGELKIEVGKKTLTMMALPGHSPDSIGVYLEEDRVLFAGDSYMPLPFLVDGDIEEMINSLKNMLKMSLENLVPGHGDIVLRGEIEGSIKSSLDYLGKIRKEVRKAGRLKYPLDHLESIMVEDVGKSRVLIGGLAEELHKNNLIALFHYYYGKAPEGSEIYYD